MRGADGSRTKRSLAARRLRGAALVAVVIVAAIWSGCSVTKQNYKTLSFFFDGVPDPNLPPGALASGVEGGKPTFVVVHKPYAQEKCDECHRTKYRPSRNDSSICLACHAAVKTAHQRTHGAVEADACLWCHSPHESSQQWLLRDKDRKVCSQCHTVALLQSTKVPAHADATRGCLECHFGHGGDTSFMLKPEGSAGVPKSAGTPPEKQ